jgi:hypothetical protein
MRASNARRVTSVHRILLAVQWPEVHQRYSADEDVEVKTLAHSVISDMFFVKTRKEKLAAGNKDLQQGTANDDTSGAAQVGWLSWPDSFGMMKVA